MEEERKDSNEIDVMHYATLIPGAEMGKINKKNMNMLANEAR